MNRIRVLLKPETAKAIKKISKSKNISTSGYVRKMVEKEIKKEKKKKVNTTEILLEAARNATKGGPRDLSTNDNYLYGNI